MEYKISQELAQEIANYLQEKPYIEVHSLLAKLMKIEKIEEINEEKED